MSLEQWAASGMFYDWYLYSGDYLAHIKVLRNSAVASTETGSYLIKIEFTSLNTFWQNSFEEEERPNWRKLFPEHLKALYCLDRKPSPRQELQEWKLTRVTKLPPWNWLTEIVEMI